MICPFCEIVRNHTERLICESEHTFTVLSNPRLMPGHTLVIPKRHVERLSELTDVELSDLCAQTIAVQERLLASGIPGCDIAQHFRPFIPQGRLKVDHLHMHVKPRFPNDTVYERALIYERDIFEDLTEEERSTYTRLLE